MIATDLHAFIRDVPDFPKPGITFKDITPLLRSPEAMDAACSELAAPYVGQGISLVAGIESRGFIFGAVVARILGAGFVPVRKPGKLPWATRRQEYDLEYGSDAVEMHVDAVGPSDRVLLIDDVLATGGTLNAAAQLIRGFDATLVAAATVVELEFLHGRQRVVPAASIHTLLRY